MAAVRKEVSHSWKVITGGLFPRGVGLFSPAPAMSAHPFLGAVVAKELDLFPFSAFPFKYELSSFTSLIFFAPRGSRNTFFFPAAGCSASYLALVTQGLFLFF